MLFVSMPFNFQMICSVSSFTYGGLIIFSLRASIESNLHYTKHGMPCTTWPHIDLLIEIQFIEIHSGLKYVARMTVLYYGAVKDLFFISKRNMATRILWKMLTRIFCEKCSELSLTRIFLIVWSGGNICCFQNLLIYEWYGTNYRLHLHIVPTHT